MAPQVDPVKPVKNWLVYTNQEQPLFNIDTVPEATILKHLKKLKSSKTLPSDDIDGFGLQLVAPILLPTITHIVNLSITIGTDTKF